MIHKLNNNFFAIEIPSMAFGIMINNYANESELIYMVDIAEITDLPEYKHDESLIVKKLPPGKWEYICTSKDITNEIAKDIGAELCNGNDKEIYGIKLGQPVYEHIAGSPIETIIKLLRSLSLTGDIAIIKNQE
jgi:hypothetical protein